MALPFFPAFEFDPVISERGATVPQEPFMWGSGGRRMTPEDIERERAVAMSLMQPDFSPVQHWTQGLGRVANAALGGLRERRADRASAANAAESDAVAKALMSPAASEVPVSVGGTPSVDPVAAALTNRYIDPAVRKLAMEQFELRNKRVEPIKIDGKLVDPTTLKVLGDFSTPDMFTQMIASAGIDPKTPEGMDLFRRRAENLADPVVNVPLPGGSYYIGPRSGMEAAIARSASGGSGGGATPPATLPPDFDFDDGGPTQPASGGFRP